MKIKVFILEVSFFDAVVWKDVNYEITATSMFQLIRTFINITGGIYEYGTGIDENDLRRKLWNNIKNDIEETYIQFPIVK